MWTLGALSTNKQEAAKGVRYVERNGVRMGGALAFEIGRCKDEVFVLGRLRTWWWFTKSTWVDTKTAKLPCG